MKTKLSQYILLTKPSIMYLVLFTGAAALVVEGSLLREPAKFVLVLLGLYLSGGSANALNQYSERDIDAAMTRTRKRRPLPMGTISPGSALVFSVSIGVAGVVLFGLAFNWLTAGLALFTILFYSFYYTLWLKPKTVQNIVIGGIAGAMAPVGAWTAATGQMAVAPWIMFLIVFLWTPPHFWSLALFCKDDYAGVNLPMLPVIKGEEATLNQIFYYSVVLVGASLALAFVEVGWLYVLTAVALGGVYVARTFLAMRNRAVKQARSLFGFSIVYLFGLFTAMMVDAVLAAHSPFPPLRLLLH